MDSDQYTTIRHNLIHRAFFGEKIDDLPAFLTSIGLRFADLNPKMSKEAYTYQIIDEKKWLFAKIKYGL